MLTGLGAIKAMDYDYGLVGGIKTAPVQRFTAVDIQEHPSFVFTATEKVGE